LSFTARPVIFVVFGDYSNLGVGYMSAVLKQAGFESRIVDFRLPNDKILAIIRHVNPLIVGFSVIYEGYIDQFARLVTLLRNKGICCHFTAGGHYASLRPRELFSMIPGLDSIVRFEGEYTLTELAACLRSRKEWRNIRSLAFRDDHGIVETPLRPLEPDLDKIPWPVRPPLREYASGRKYVTLLAGRGCLNSCSYCNAREFYRIPSGPTKRTRKPEMVAAEMEYLHRNKACSVYLFQDDDFPVTRRGDTDWIKSFCNELRSRGLHDRIIWKINCRPDELNEENIGMMRQHGLCLVFIGLEDGTDEGLARLNKRTTVADNLRCIDLLKKHDTGFDYGFMMFQPDTTCDTLSANLTFLRKICSDGYTSFSFLKLMPYFETQIEKKLREQGRLKGRPGYYDYDFMAKSLDECYDTVVKCFAQWMWSNNGVTNLSGWIRNHFIVHDFFGPAKTDVEILRQEFRETLSESNTYIMDRIEELFYFYSPGSNNKAGRQVVEKIEADARDMHSMYFKSLNRILQRLKD
jgi:anaerobic magnesium-protoporphyrin IX monomethyl ester cyclase